MNLRKINSNDKDKYLEMTAAFYSSEAVDHKVDPQNCVNTFDELMSSDTYAECYIIEESAKIAGYVLLSKSYSQEVGGICIWFEEIWIEPDFRGNGIGSKVLNQVMELHSEAARFRLEYAPANPRAAELYRRMGFEDLNYMQMCLDK